MLLLHFAGALQHDPITLRAGFLAFASAMNGPVRLPSVFMPTRRMDKPVESAAVVVKSLSTGKLLPLGISAVLMPKPWMVWWVAASCTVTPVELVPPAAP